MKTFSNKNSIKTNLIKFSSFNTNRTFFIEQLLGILQFTIKKGLKKKLKRNLNLLLSNTFIKNNSELYKFNNKLIKYKQPYKTLSKRKKKWKRRLFFIKQKEFRVTPYMKNNFFSKKLKQISKRRPQNFLIFLNSKEQMHEIKKIYINLVKNNKAPNFYMTFQKQINYFLSLKTIKVEKKIGWIKFLIKQSLQKNTITKNRLKIENNLTYNKKYFYKKKFKYLISQKKRKSLLSFFKFKKLKKKETKLKTLTYKKKLYNINYNLYKKYIVKKYLKKSQIIKNNTEKKFYSTKTKKNNQIYELYFYSNEKYNLLKVEKHTKNYFINNLKNNFIIFPIQKENKKITVLKSPHVNKTARNQYEHIRYNLKIQINSNYISEKKIFNLIFKLKNFFSFLDFSFKLKNI